MWYRAKQRILNRGISNSQETLKGMFTVLSHQGKQIKTTLRFHLIPIRMAKIKISSDSSCWLGCGVGGCKLHCRSANSYNHFGSQFGGFSKT